MAAFAGACSTVPKTTSLLDQTRSDYMAAQSNPNVASYAQLEFKQASDALDQANAASNHHDSEEKIDKLAYLAKQKIALAQEVAKQRAAEASVARSAKERDQLRLDQRTSEAEQAKMEAERARMNAEQSRMTAEQSRLAAQQAQDQAAASQRQTQEAQARAAQLEAQLADLAAKKTDRGMVITLGDVLFAVDQERLNAEGMRTAQKLAGFLQQYPQRTVLIEGYTDSTGSVQHNQELSERRAASVRNALLELGVPSGRISIAGYGPSYPVAPNDTAQNRQLNRRVEIVLSDESGNIVKR